MLYTKNAFYLLTYLLTYDLVVPWTRSAGFSLRSFPVAGPLAWNSLPSEIETSLTLRQFSGRLKTETYLRS